MVLCGLLGISWACPYKPSHPISPRPQCRSNTRSGGWGANSHIVCGTLHLPDAATRRGGCSKASQRQRILLAWSWDKTALVYTPKRKQVWHFTAANKRSSCISGRWGQSGYIFGRCFTASVRLKTEITAHVQIKTQLNVLHSPPILPTLIEREWIWLVR